MCGRCMLHGQTYRDSLHIPQQFRCVSIEFIASDWMVVCVSPCDKLSILFLHTDNLERVEQL